MEPVLLAEKILEQLNLKLSVIDMEFLSAEEMQALNKRTRGKDEVTDVLSYPNLNLKPEEAINFSDYPNDIEDGKLFLGSIALCNSRIEEQAAEYGHSVLHEKAYLITHGILHLLGYDHMNDSDKKVMRNKEKEIMAFLEI